MTDPEIRSTLHNVVPDDLSAAGLADGARRKLRNRRQAVAGVSALALVAVAVPLALNLSGKDGPLAATPAEQNTSDTVGENAQDPVTPAVEASQSAWIPEKCARDWSSVTASSNLGEIVPGATQAWLCGDAGEAMSAGGGWSGPMEPLTVGVDKAIEAFQALPVADPTVMMCTADYRLTYHLVLEYADGKERIVTGELHGCGFVFDDHPNFYEGGPAYLDTLVGLWQAQRDAGGAPFEREADLCPGSTPIMGAPADPTRGAVCFTYAAPDGGQGNEIAQTSPELLTTLIEGYKSGEASDGVAADYSGLSVTLADRYGDRIAMQLHTNGQFSWYDGKTTRVWTPPQGVVDEVEALRAAHPNYEPVTPTQPKPPEGQSTPGSEGTGTPITPPDNDVLPTRELPAQGEGCAGALEGTLQSTPIPGGTLPGDPEEVWLCLKGMNDGYLMGGVGPLEPLTMRQFKNYAVEGYNSLPTMAAVACTEELGPSYYVIYQYADGKRYVVEVQLYGCDPVLAGDNVRSDGQQFFDSLVKHWEGQRGAEPTTTAVMRPGSVCPSANNLFAPVTPGVEEFASGVVCANWGEFMGISDGDGKETPLAPDLLAALNEGLKEAVDDGGGSRVMAGDSVVLINAWGDPMTLDYSSDGTLHWSSSKGMRMWTPTGALADELKAAFQS